MADFSNLIKEALLMCQMSFFYYIIKIDEIFFAKFSMKMAN